MKTSTAEFKDAIEEKKRRDSVRPPTGETTGLEHAQGTTARGLITTAPSVRYVGVQEVVAEITVVDHSTLTLCLYHYVDDDEPFEIVVMTKEMARMRIPDSDYKVGATYYWSTGQMSVNGGAAKGFSKFVRRRIVGLSNPERYDSTRTPD